MAAAAKAAGINARNLRKWLALGADGVEPYATFAAEVDAAQLGHLSDRAKHIGADLRNRRVS